MQAKLIGIQSIDFTNTKGEQVKGKNVFLIFADDKVEGLCADKFFLKEGITLPKGIEINSDIDVLFDRKGRPERIVKL